MSKKLSKPRLVLISNITSGGTAQTFVKPITKTLDEIVEEGKSFKITNFPEVQELPNCIINYKGSRSVIPEDFYRKNKKNSSKK